MERRPSLQPFAPLSTRLAAGRSHSVIVCAAAEARVLPSGLKATAFTGPACPWRVSRSLGSWADTGESLPSPKQASNSSGRCRFIGKLLHAGKGHLHCHRKSGAGQGDKGRKRFAPRRQVRKAGKQNLGVTRVAPQATVIRAKWAQDD